MVITRVLRVLLAISVVALQTYAWQLSRQRLSMRACAGTPSDVKVLHLTPKLRDYSVQLRVAPDDKLRYQQLLFLGSKCPPMMSQHKVDENKVPGCLSSVYIHASRASDGTISYTGDSDSQLTKGLVALLVDGLSGYTPEVIEKVDPGFIQYAGIGSSLTPGRNNGLLNMLTLMKLKAKQLGRAEHDSAEGESRAGTVDGPLARSMIEKLAKLQPTVLRVENTSQQHAGHPEMAASIGRVKETHFNVHIVADCFATLSLVLRHQMVYALLEAELQGGVHALSITARTPAEETATKKSKTSS
jgi:sulfur transfer protein SufE/stress-induced morphogen